MVTKGSPTGASHHQGLNRVPSTEGNTIHEQQEPADAADGGDSMTPAELLKRYYALDTKLEMEQLAYLEELGEQQRAAKRAAVVVTA